MKDLGVVKFAQGESFNQYQFKEGKTAVVEMEQIHKLEKGSVKKSVTGHAKPKVLGGKVVKGSKKSAGSKGVGNITNKISKHSVAIGKKSHV